MTPIEAVLSKLPSAKGNGNGWSARCPAHDDQHASLSVAEADDGTVLIKCHAGCETAAVCEAIGVTLRELFPPRLDRDAGPASRRGSRPRSGKRASEGETYASRDDAIHAAAASVGGKIVAGWPYHASDGRVVLWVVRFDTADGKAFRPIRPDGDHWRIGDPPGLLPLYQLPTLAGVKRVFVCEGEKAVDAARAVQIVATTSAHGAQAAAKTDWTPLTGFEVIILPDNDDSGRKYTDDVAAILAKLQPRPTVRIVTLPGLPPHGDFVEFAEARKGQTAEAIRAAVEALADDVLFAAPILVRLADVEPEPVRWLWPSRIALGKLTLIAGDPGLGKSFLGLYLAACVSRGWPWPDDRDTFAPLGSVVLLSAEDDLEDTIRPRLDAAEADVSRIVSLKSVKRTAENGHAATCPFSLERDLPALEAAIRRVGNCWLIVIDPISAYLGATDSHKNADIRGILAPLADLASRYKVAIVCITHLNKSAGMSAMYRTTGSLAFVAAARAVWAVSRDRDDPKRRLFLPVKNNLGNDQTGLAYALRPTATGIPCVAWEPDPVSVTADDVLSPDQRSDAGRSDREDAAAWLREALASGPMPAANVLSEAKENGIAEKTLRRAAKLINVVRRKSGFAGGWSWSLPPQGGQVRPEDSQDTHTGDVAIFGDVGHLRTPDAGREVGEL